MCDHRCSSCGGLLAGTLKPAAWGLFLFIVGLIAFVSFVAVQT